MLTLQAAEDLLKESSFRFDLGFDRAATRTRYSGTGFFVKSAAPARLRARGHYALTAFHNLEGFEPGATLEGYHDGKLLEFEWLADQSSRQADIAVLRLLNVPEGVQIRGLPVGYLDPKATLADRRTFFAAVASVSVYGFPQLQVGAVGTRIDGGVDSSQAIVETSEGVERRQRLSIVGSRTDSLDGMSGAAVFDRSRRIVVGVQGAQDDLLKGAVVSGSRRVLASEIGLLVAEHDHLRRHFSLLESPKGGLRGWTTAAVWVITLLALVVWSTLGGDPEIVVRSTPTPPSPESTRITPPAQPSVVDRTPDEPESEAGPRNPPSTPGGTKEPPGPAAAAGDSELDSGRQNAPSPAPDLPSPTNSSATGSIVSPSPSAFEHTNSGGGSVAPTNEVDLTVDDRRRAALLRSSLEQLVDEMAAIREGLTTLCSARGGARSRLLAEGADPKDAGVTRKQLAQNEAWKRHRNIDERLHVLHEHLAVARLYRGLDCLNKRAGLEDFCGSGSNRTERAANWACDDRGALLEANRVALEEVRGLINGCIDSRCP